MRLMEDLSSIPLTQKNQQVIIQQVATNQSQIPLPPIPSKTEHKTARAYNSSLTQLELLLEVKKRLLERKKYVETEVGKFIVTDESYLDVNQKKQLEKESIEIEEKINKLLLLKQEIKQIEA